MPKKPHYSEKTDDEKIDEIARRHLQAPRGSKLRTQRTLYLSDEYFLPAKEILGSRVSEYLDDCLAHLIASHELIRNRAEK